MKRKLLSTLGICKKAGRLAEGFDPVAEAMGKGTVSLVLTASDLSPKSEKEILRVAGSHGVEHMKLEATMDEIWAALGKRAGILAIADEGLAGAVRKAAQEEPAV